MLSASTHLVSHEDLLETHGIQPEYYDLWGRPHKVDPAVADAIVRAMGPADCTRRLIPQTSVLLRGEALPVDSRFPHLPVEAAFYWEDGGSLVTRSPLVPIDAPHGYHRVAVRCGAESADGVLIVTPERAIQVSDRHRGFAISLYSLRSARNQGVGDFTDLRAISTWAASGLKADFIALNPLHAIPNRQPYNTSPYLPMTTLFRNFLYLDVAEVAGCPDLAPYEARFADLRATEHVEYEKVAGLKLEILRKCFNAAAAAVSADEDLRLFATYQALYDHIHAASPDVWLWQDWPEEYRDARSPAVAAFAEAHSEEVAFYEFVQRQIDLQLAAAQKHCLEACGMRIGLYHDLALAVDRSGFDAWAFPEFYIKGCRVGSPPDDFAPEGQDWSFPPPNVNLHRATGYKRFAATIRNNCSHGGALRLDHVMRLFRLFWIPDGFNASEGAYVRDHARDLLRILALESHRNNVLIVGEDLGTITDEMREGLRDAGILSYRLLYFERHWDGRFKRPEEYPEQAIVCTTTHDLPTIAGFWAGRDIEVRREVGLILDEASYLEQRSRRREDKAKMAEALGLAPGVVDKVPLPVEVRDAMLAFLERTPALLFAITQEDLTRYPEQQNLPGTTWQHPNWRRKMPVTIEELAGGQR